MLRWWRREAETSVRRRNPLLSLPGLTPQHFVVDSPHTLYLGPARDWIGAVFWRLIDDKVFWDGRDQTDTAQMTVLEIRRHLTSWYTDYEREHPEIQITRLDNLELPMLGSRSSPQLSSKAAETKGLIPFGVHPFETHASEVKGNGRSLLRVGEAMMEIVAVLHEAPRILTASGTQRFHDAFNTMARYWSLAGLGKKPKLHLLMHMVGNSDFHGNPGLHSTFVDEGLNKVLAQIGRSAHRRVWELRVFAHFARAQDPVRKSLRCA